MCMHMPAHILTHAHMHVCVQTLIHLHAHTHMQIISHDLRKPIGIAVDWKGNNIYFSDTRNPDRLGRIEVASCDGKRRKVLFHNLTRPGPLALNVLTG